MGPVSKLIFLGCLTLAVSGSPVYYGHYSMMTPGALTPAVSGAPGGHGYELSTTPCPKHHDFSQASSVPVRIHFGEQTQGAQTHGPLAVPQRLGHSAFHHDFVPGHFMMTPDFSSFNSLHAHMARMAPLASRSESAPAADSSQATSTYSAATYTPQSTSTQAPTIIVSPEIVTTPSPAVTYNGYATPAPAAPAVPAAPAPVVAPGVPAAPAPVVAPGVPAAPAPVVAPGVPAAPAPVVAPGVPAPAAPTVPATVVPAAPAAVVPAVPAPAVPAVPAPVVPAVPAPVVPAVPVPAVPAIPAASFPATPVQHPASGSTDQRAALRELSQAHLHAVNHLYSAHEAAHAATREGSSTLHAHSTRNLALTHNAAVQELLADHSKHLDVPPQQPTAAGIPMFAQAITRGTPQHIPILDFTAEILDGRRNAFSFDAANGIHQQETTNIQHIPGAPGECDKTLMTKTGSVSYVSPEGQHIHLTYVGDKDGFHAHGSHLPTPPPIPIGIQRGLQELRAKGKL